MSIVSHLDLEVIFGLPTALAVPIAAAFSALEPPPVADLSLTPAEAIALLPTSDRIHVQIGASTRERWSRADVAAAITAGSDRRLAIYALKAGFGLSCVRDTGQSLLIQTDDAKVRGWLERQAKRAGE